MHAVVAHLHSRPCMQVSFPIAWLMYSAPKDWQFINFIHFLAPFVILGIGLDDIFVSMEFFQNTRPFMGYFALDTRLTQAFQASSSSMLATSTTSAFAFAANIFSPVPAIQSFGLLLATLVVVNYILAITWLPVCLAVWDYHFEFPRRAAEARGAPTCCSCTLFTCCSCCASRAPRMGGAGQTLSIVKGGQEPRALEFMQVRAGIHADCTRTDCAAVAAALVHCACAAVMRVVRVSGRARA
jgi:Patched family